jgi:predicted  nucleic acid-binding Zn-ribbon protein
MGLFDWLGKEPDTDADSDAETDASAAAAPRRTETPAAAASQKPAATPTARTTPTASEAPDMPEFGIQKAIQLMRELPQQNVELVVAVVKKTLESMSVDVATIIDDAKTKQAKIQGRIKTLEDEIQELKDEISAREEEISALKTDFAETRQVRERLELAQKTPSAPKADPVAPPGTAIRAPAAVRPPGESTSDAKTPG